jgi:hypothetical protein
MAYPSLDLLSPGQQAVGMNINMLSSLVKETQDRNRPQGVILVRMKKKALGAYT